MTYWLVLLVYVAWFAYMANLLRLAGGKKRSPVPSYDERGVILEEASQ